MDRPMDRWTDWWTDGLTNRQRDQWMEGLMDQRTDGFNRPVSQFPVPSFPVLRAKTLITCKISVRFAKSLQILYVTCVMTFNDDNDITSWNQIKIGQWQLKWCEVLHFFWGFFLGLSLTHWKYFQSRSCDSIWEYVRPSVRPSICLSFMHFFWTTVFKPKSDLTSINPPAQRTWLILSCIQTCFVKVP